MSRSVARPLAIWSAVLLVLLAGHDLTHALDGGLETKLGPLALIAVPQWLVLTVLMAVIVRAGQVRAAVAALLLGIGVTLGFLAIHLLPFSTASYWDLHPSAVSWLFAWAPPAVGVVVIALAWAQLRPAVRAPAHAA
jgi:hypothetical protein